MKTYTVEVISHWPVEATSPREAVRSFNKIGKGGKATGVSGYNMVGYDEDTDEPIFDTDIYLSDAEDSSLFLTNADTSLGKAKVIQLT